MVRVIDREDMVGELPSETAAKHLIQGDPGAFWEMALSTLERAAIISVPLFLLKIKPWKVIAGSLLSATLITFFVIGYVRDQEKAPPPKS